MLLHGNHYVCTGSQLFTKRTCRQAGGFIYTVSGYDSNAPLSVGIYDIAHLFVDQKTKNVGAIGKSWHNQYNRSGLFGSEALS